MARFSTGRDGIKSSHISTSMLIQCAARSISSKLALLRRIKRYLPIQYRTLFDNSNILSSLDYCLSIWGNAPKTHIERLHKVQKCAAPIIMDAASDASSQPLFNDLNWLNMFDRIQYNKGILMSKILNGLSPTYLHNLFSPQSSSNNHSWSVSNRNLCIPMHSTESFKRTLQYSGAKL